MITVARRERSATEALATPETPTLDEARPWDSEGRVPWCPACRRAWFADRVEDGACPRCETPLSACETDPFDVVPEALLDAYGAETAEEAVAAVEREPSTTSRDEMKRCPAENCGTVRVYGKPGDGRDPQKINTNYKCGNSACGEHFDNPLPPRSAFDAEDPVCPSCGSPRLRLLPRGRVRCLDCESEHDGAADAAEDDVSDAEGDDAPSDDQHNETEHTPMSARTTAFDWIEPTDLVEPATPSVDEVDETDGEEIGHGPTMTAEAAALAELTGPRPADLRAIRESLGLSLRDVPLAAGSTLGRWETGETHPRLDRLKTLLAYYRTIDAVRRADRVGEAVPDAVAASFGGDGE